MTLIEYHRRKLAALQQIYALALNAREQCEEGSPEDRGYTLALDALSVLNRAVASLLADITQHEETKRQSSPVVATVSDVSTA